MDKLINAIMAELEPIANGESETGNYWINNNYNVFAFHEDNGDGDEWISVKLEQYDDNEECVNCELYFADTDDMSLAGLEVVIKEVVEWYTANIEKRQTEMSKQYQKGQELLCIKEMALDEESYGIDCYINSKYRITSEDPEGFYVETESGSEVLLSETEIQEYFKIA